MFGLGLSLPTVALMAGGGAPPFVPPPPPDPGSTSATGSVAPPPEATVFAGQATAIAGWVENQPGEVFLALRTGGAQQGARIACDRWSTFFIARATPASPGTYRAELWDAATGGAKIAESVDWTVTPSPLSAPAPAAAPTTSLDINLAAGGDDPFASGLLTLTRATAGMAQATGRLGQFTSFAAGVPRRTNQGLLLEPARVNGVRNNSMIGAALGVIGSGGSYPTGTNPIGWVEAAPAGITREVMEFGLADPVLGLPYIDVQFSGTPTANTNWGLQWHGGSAIGAAGLTSNFVEIGACIRAGAWVGVVSGSLFGTWTLGGSAPANATPGVLARVYNEVSNNVGSITGWPRLSSEPLMLEDTAAEPWRLVSPVRVVAQGTGSQIPGFIRCGINLSFAANHSYSLRIRIIAPQCERVEDVNSDLSSPILTTNAPLARAADVVTLGGGLLTAIQGGAATVRMDTRGFLAGRRAHDMLIVNDTVPALRREVNGSVSSAIGGAPVATYRSQRTNWLMEQTSGVSWGNGGVRVASTSPAWHADAPGTAPTITSARLGVGFYLRRLRAGNGHVDLTPLRNISAETVIYGATAGAVTAAIALRRRNRTFAIVGSWREVRPGAMLTGGLSEVDVGTTDAFGPYGSPSYARDYLHWSARLRGQVPPDNGNQDWNVGPDVADAWLEKLIIRFGLTMSWSKGLASVSKTGTRITGFTTRDGKGVVCTYAIDASYEGDLMAAAGASYFVGREASDAANVRNGYRSTDGFTSPNGDDGGSFSQTYDPRNTLIRWRISPHREAGNPASGLLPMIETQPATARGAADDAVMNFNFRQALTRLSTRNTPMPTTPPPGYRPEHYEVLARWMARQTAEGRVYVNDDAAPGPNQWSLSDLVIPNAYDNQITDLNQTGPQGSNLPGGSRIYPEADYPERAAIWKLHEHYLRGWWYWLQYSGDPRIPALLVTDARAFGFVMGLYDEPHEDDAVGWMPQLYVRVGRRLRGDYIMSGADLIAPNGTPVPGPSGQALSAGSYPSDSHHVRRFAAQIDGEWATVSEGNLFFVDSTPGGDRIFPMPIEVFTPKKTEIENLGVIFAVSASHVCFGAFRMEMSLMQAGEAMGEAIALCLETGSPAIQDVNFTTLRPRLAAAGINAPLTN